MVSRRDMMRVLGALPAAGALGRGRLYAQAAQRFHHRQLGRTGRWIVPLGLGGQGSLEWTGAGIDPADIIVRAVQLGVNYLDTANAYGPSQSNYGEAFRRLRLAPGQNGYNAALRERLFLATKTKARTAKDAVEELKHSLSVVFGDGEDHIPKGAYLDSIQIHNIRTLEEVDQIYADNGLLAGLLDYRDGTNHTGLNPEHHHYVRHIGITGHKSSEVLMNALQRDTDSVLDTLLVALNANDRRCCAHQNNVLPVAMARGMGVIAMKVFADGAFYGKPPRFSRAPDDVILSAGKPDAVACEDLVRYAVSLAGVSCAVTGIGRIDRDKPENDQLAVNLTAALGDLASERDRLAIEKDVRSRHGATTNYFQDPSRGLVQPTGIGTEKDGDRVSIQWNTALAGAEPIRSYLVVAGERLLASLPFRPQTTLEPLSLTLPASEIKGEPVSVIASIRPPRPLG